MAGMQIRRDDTVMVTAGKDRGHTGRVVRVFPKKGRIHVEGAGRAKRHSRSAGKRTSSGQQLQQGGILDIELPVHASNVQVVCPSCGKPTRIGHRMEDGVKIRICRRCEADL